MWVWGLCELPAVRECGPGHLPDDLCTRAGSNGRASQELLCQHTSADLGLRFCLSHSPQLKLVPLEEHGSTRREEGRAPCVSPHSWEAVWGTDQCRFQRQILFPARPLTNNVNLGSMLNLPVSFPHLHDGDDKCVYLVRLLNR